MGGFKALGAVCMDAALGGCRITLVCVGWAISHLFSTNGHTSHFSPLVGESFLYCRQFSVRIEEH